MTKAWIGDRIIRKEHERINAPAPGIELGPWPREGETWGPTFPWPISGCPVGLYIHGYSETLVGGTAGWTFGIMGVTFISPGLPPMSTEAATAMAWEFRYGSANIKERHSTLAFAPGSGMRNGPEPIVIDAVGAGNIYGHYLDGRPVILPALDLRRGWGRIEHRT
jgi:hypothetical protein